VDPLGARKILPYKVTQVLFSVSLPFGIASSLLVLFYWEEIFDKRNMKLSPFLRRLVLPFLIFVALVVLLDLAGSIFTSLSFHS
jgi:Mn2+/Fe2+ NRAMP family transporter